MNSNNRLDQKEFTAEDVIGVIPGMSLGLIQEYEKFESCIENYVTSCKKYQSIVLDHRNLMGDFPNRLRSSLDEVAEKISKNKHILEEKKSEEEELKKIIKDLDESISENEEKVESLKQKISRLRDKEKTLDEKRDKILVYKLLTKTNFCYEGATVSGYVCDEKTKKIKCFNYDPEQLSQKEITDKLYEDLKKVSQGTTEVQNVKVDYSNL